MLHCIKTCLNSRMIKTPLIGLLLVLFVVTSCKKEDLLEPTSYLADQTFKKNLRVDGHDFDHLIIENCIFDGATLNIGNADSVTIRNCTFKDIKGNGIKVGFIGPARSVRIENCSFENIGFNAIDSHEDAPNGTISNCYFNNVAQSQTGAAMAQAHHAIYWKGQNVTIEKSRFIGGDQTFGNAISVRSSGIIQQNIISGYPKNGIMYYSDHPGGEYLLIENNFLYDNEYSITMGTLGNLNLHNERVIIRFNSAVQEENYSIYVAKEFETTTDVEIYGNIVVNSTEGYIKMYFPLHTLMSNVTSPQDIGFVHIASGDLHLAPNSQAYGKATGVPSFPYLDIDGDLRNQSILNAGADE